jgi:hypothetical protein
MEGLEKKNSIAGNGVVVDKAQVVTVLDLIIALRI